MKQAYLGFIVFILIGTLSSSAQKVNYNKSERQQIPLAGTVNLSEIKEDFAPVVNRLEMPHPNTNRAKLNELKVQAKRWFDENRSGQSQKVQGAKTSSVEVPSVIKDFKGNPYSGVPCDNSMAISDEGLLLSVINSTIFVYDVEADEELALVSLGAFIQEEETISTRKYDPVVLYDHDKDRFAMVFLSGVEHQESEIIVAFSASNDPSTNWFKYVLSGNPLDNDTWSDFPHIAVNEREFFIAVNTYFNGSSNNSGYYESTLWQIGKQTAFLGLDLEADYYTGITFDDRPVYNLTPIGGAYQHYGDNMYILSNWGFDFPDDGIDGLKNDSILILQVTDDLWNDDREITIDVVRSDLEYFIPVLGMQPGSNTFDTNDAKVLGGFYHEEDDYIEFVLNSSDLHEGGTGFASIYHGVINNVTTEPECTGHMITHPELSLAFPNIAYTGNGPGDRQSIIGFNHSGDEDFPGCSAVMYQHGEYSDVLMVKEGESYVNQIGGPLERWGDYSGIQRRFSNPGEVWMSGYYGASGTPLSPNRNETWIIGLQSTAEPVPVQIESSELEGLSASRIFPNPAWEMAHYEFSVIEPMLVTFSVFDISGQLIKKVYHSRCETGKHSFSFNTAALAPGQYLLVGDGPAGKVLEEQFMVK